MKRFLIQLGLAGLFVLTSAVIVGWASGLIINWRAHSIEQLGGIRLGFQPTSAELTLNNQLVSSRSPFQTTSLRPGTYTLHLHKDGYHDWQESLVVKSGQVTERDSILLFFDQLKPEPVVDPAEMATAKDQLAKPASPDRFGQIRVVGSELFIDNSFVTRFSDDIVQASWYSDPEHVLLQVGRQLMVAETDGQDRVILDQAPDQSKLTIATDSAERVLYLFNGDKIEKINLR